MKSTALLLCLCTALACGMPKYVIVQQPNTVQQTADGRLNFTPAGPLKLAF